MACKVLDSKDFSVTRENIKKELKKVQNEVLFDSSKGKHIVVFIGNTGSGKSTLINYLTKIELTVDHLDNIVLKNPYDQTAMIIGNGNVSETSLPKYIECNQLLFYDLPGFQDTRGTVTNLVNAALIKNIIENAKTVRIVIVIGIDEITAGRGNLVKQILGSIKTLIPNEEINEISGFVITKTKADQSFEQLNEILKQKTSEALEQWHQKGHLAAMKSPSNKCINKDERESILNMILKIKNKHIKNVNIVSIYSYSDCSSIKSIYIEEMQDVFNSFLRTIIDTTQIKSFTLPFLESKMIELNDLINNCKFDTSTLIPLLRTISSDVHDKALKEFKEKIEKDVEIIILSMTAEIKDKQRIKAEKKCKKDASLRELIEKDYNEKISLIEANFMRQQRSLEEQLQIEKTERQKSEQKYKDEKSSIEKEFEMKLQKAEEELKRVQSELEKNKKLFEDKVSSFQREMNTKVNQLESDGKKREDEFLSFKDECDRKQKESKRKFEKELSNNAEMVDKLKNEFYNKEKELKRKFEKDLFDKDNQNKKLIDEHSLLTSNFEKENQRAKQTFEQEKASRKKIEEEHENENQKNTEHIKNLEEEVKKKKKWCKLF